MSQTLTVEGAPRPLVRQFSDHRALVELDGVYVLADRGPAGVWSFSGEPARPGVEADTVRELVAAAPELVVTVTHDEAEVEP